MVVKRDLFFVIGVLLVIVGLYIRGMGMKNGWFKPGSEFWLFYLGGSSLIAIGATLLAVSFRLL